MESWLSLANVTVLNAVHPRNANGGIVIIEAGTKTLPVDASGTIKHWFTPVFENAKLPMLWSRLPLVKLTVARLEAPEKA